jgi:hypothetical protein
MKQESKFYVNRTIKTISAARLIAADWVWDEITPDAMQTQLTAVTGNNTVSPPIIGQEEIASRADSVLAGKRGAWDAQLKVLHVTTQLGLALGKKHFRNDPASAAVVSGLVAEGKSREGILTEALAWESAWNNLDATWVPDRSLGLAAFRLLRKQCAEDLQTAFSTADTDCKEQNSKLEQMCADLEATNVAWYAVATRLFPAGTPHGDMIRSTVPTTYTPVAAKAKPAPTPTPPATAASAA